MKKVLGLVVFLAFVSQIAHSAQETKLEFKLKGTYYVKRLEKFKKVNLKALNKKLISLHPAELPENVELPEKIQVGKNAKLYWDILVKRIEAANQVVSDKMWFNITDDRDLREYSPICYRGKSSDVPAILKSFQNGSNGNFMRGDAGLLAIRYGETIEIYHNDEVFNSEEKLKELYAADNADEVNDWLRYDKSSDVVLVMTDFGGQGDGTELISTFIEKCNKE